MTTNLDLMISMFISFILIAGILYVSDFSLRDFGKIEKVIIVSIISLIYVLTVIMVKIPTSYIIDKFSASYKTEELTVEVTDKEIVKSSILRPYMIGKNVVFVPYPSTHYTITVKNDNEDIKVEVSEQEYNDIKVNDIVTVEKVEKYRSSEYVNTTYQLKN
jgi:hypothetical protein